ncbi:MAG: PRC-barrel domain-containing protein [Bacteroidota bacterium]|nr:PRC-barrel domain-containing protein [Bacteroidota bacterium]
MYKEKYLVNSNLKELRSSDFEISKGEPDIRGWKVKTTQNQDIGKVDELLFDSASFRVRYLVVALNGKAINLASRDVLIPVGLAELRKDDKTVIFPDVTAGHFASLPEYKKGNVTVETERAIRTVFAPSDGVVYKDADYEHDPEEFYDHNHFDEEKMYKSGTSTDETIDPLLDERKDANMQQQIINRDERTQI